ncbi:hypothetical protein CEXT_281761 [Caerostris extrusa]|uniref:Uncharacterized protein n=1 Tax=Caerostris extrusa TaxID=172846 RepID=A0AAV4XS73_CAEEX|nr:hypothetical protein CEXT_281761 [Caerostris extrusa]
MLTSLDILDQFTSGSQSKTTKFQQSWRYAPFEDKNSITGVLFTKRASKCCENHVTRLYLTCSSPVRTKGPPSDRSTILQRDPFRSGCVTMHFNEQSMI